MQHPAADPFTSEKYLQALMFDSTPNALHHIEIEAMKQGWNVGCMQRISEMREGSWKADYEDWL